MAIVMRLAVLCASAMLAIAAPMPAHAAIGVVDDAGARIELAAPATRIVTLAPHATELVYVAGAGTRIVGVVAGTDYPAAARSLPVVGDANALDLERIAMLSPDLIVTWPWTTPAQVSSLRARGIAVFDANARSIVGIADDVEKIGRLTETSDVATPAANAFRLHLAKLKAEHRTGAPLRVFYEVSDEPLFTLGGKHLVSQALTLCGGENVFASLSIPAPQVGIEAVLAANPQVIIAGTNDARRPAWLDAWTRWPAIDAVRHRTLYAVDANLLHRPGPRFIDGVEQLCATLANARRAIASNAYDPRAAAHTASTR